MGQLNDYKQSIGRILLNYIEKGTDTCICNWNVNYGYYIIILSSNFSQLVLYCTYIHSESFSSVYCLKGVIFHITVLYYIGSDTFKFFISITIYFFIWLICNYLFSLNILSISISLSIDHSILQRQSSVKDCS